MSYNNPIVPPGVVTGHDDEQVDTREVDGEEVLDDDLDADSVSSIDADRVASQEPDAD